MTDAPRLVLASTSPRRLELLGRLGLTPGRLAAPDVDEAPLFAEPPRTYVLRVALAKARAVERAPDEIVLAGDTTVAAGRRILGKPADAADAAGAGSQEQRQEETTNYEIGKTVRTLVREQPQIRRISLAVMVDGVAERGPDGVPVWRERAPEELARIATLVRSAVGFDERRGDRPGVPQDRHALRHACARWLRAREERARVRGVDDRHRSGGRKGNAGAGLARRVGRARGLGG